MTSLDDIRIQVSKAARNLFHLINQLAKFKINLFRALSRRNILNLGLECPLQLQLKWLEAGCANLDKQIENCKAFGVSIRQN